MPYSHLAVRYDLERLLTDEPDDEQLDCWHIGLHRHTYIDDDDDGSPDAVPVATAQLFGFAPGRHLAVGQNPFYVADARSADTSYYFTAIFDADGNAHDDVDEAFQAPVIQALALDDVQVPLEFRRLGYGRFLAAEAILTLAKWGTAVFGHPGPTDVGEQASRDDAYREEVANTRFLAALGFAPFRDRMWTLDPSVAAPLDVLAEIRRRGIE